MVNIKNLNTEKDTRIRFIPKSDSSLSAENLNPNIVVEEDGALSFCLSANSEEMYFTTKVGTIDYRGVKGDQIVLSDGNTLTLEADSMYGITVPAGKHKIVFTDARNNDYVGISGNALVELHNFPELSTVTKFNFYTNSNSPNLVKVPTILPSNLTDLSYMFYSATAFNQDIGVWNVSNVTNMYVMFQNAKSFNQDISDWDVGNVTRMAQMFSGATSFNQPLNNWNTSNVTDMDSMFYGASAFNQDISMWDVSNVTNMDSMFYSAFEFNQDIGNWDVGNVTSMRSMFHNANALDQDLSGWCVSKITTEPTKFAMNTQLSAAQKPVWGTCPV